MNELMIAVLTWLAGILLGVMFFGGLWLTVRQGLVSSHPAAWFLGSMVVRTGLVLAGFYHVADGHWPRLLLCLLGFILARSMVARFSRRAEKRKGLAGEVGDAA